jgi:hypothetical protein
MVEELVGEPGSRERDEQLRQNRGESMHAAVALAATARAARMVRRPARFGVDRGILTTRRSFNRMGHSSFAQPFILILLGAFMAGLEMAFYGVHVWYVQRKFLPRELQPPAWRQAALLLFSAFFGFFTLVVILNRVFGIKIG